MAWTLLYYLLFFFDFICFIGIFVADSSSGSFMLFILFILFAAAIAGVRYLEGSVAKSDYWQKKFRDIQEKEDEVIKQEKEEAILSNKDGAPWRIRYATYPCPYCGHYKVRSAKWEDKRLSVAFWGAASTKIGTNYKCEYCGKMWS